MKTVPVAIALAAALLAQPALAACRRDATTFDMPAQRLDEAAQQLSRLTGCAVAVDPKLFGDRRTDPLRGKYTPEQALARLVRNTGYTAHATPTGLGIDDSVVAITMSQSRGLRTLLRNQTRAGRVPAAQSARLLRLLDAAERDVPREVNAQGMLTAAQKRDVVMKLEAVRAVVGTRYDARDWAEFKRRPY